MAAGQVNARDYIFEISDGAATPVWTQIEGLTSWELDPSENEETADTTDFDSDGDYSQHIMQRGATLELEGKRHLDEATGTAAPGQIAVEVLGTKKGVESVGTIRWRHKTETDWIVWDCTATMGERGGETNDKDGWAVTFSRNGAAREEAVAVTP